MAQTVYKMGTSTDISTCSAIIADNGDTTANYTAGRNDWMIIRPGSNGAVKIRVDFMDIASTDTLYIFNGAYTNINPNQDTVPFLIGSESANWLNNDNLFIQGDLRISATVQNPTGAITLHFVSATNSECGKGFIITVEDCVTPCQRIHANIDFQNTVPTPHFDPEMNDGYLYMDFCPGDTLHFVCYGTYPDNDYGYHQSDATTYFNWTVGGVPMQGNGMTTVDYAFAAGAGYEVSLALSDQLSGVVCYALTPVSIRIRGSRDPFVNSSLLNDVCQGDTIPLLINMDSTANIQVEPVGNQSSSSLAVDSTVFIPDGPRCQNVLGTNCFRSSVNFTSFPIGAQISSAADILSICINMEHSFNGDISIALTCPNNRSAQLKPYRQSSNTGSYFGVPYGGSGHDSYDETTYCDESHNPAGTGWWYCWSENTTYASNSGLCYNSSNIGHDASNTIDSSHVAHGYPGQGNFTQGSQYYSPTQSFSNLIGCPLNGLWSIEICDDWGIDNGYIFSWNITLDPRLMPQDWTYNVDLVSINWAGGNIIPTSDTTAAIITEQPGDYTYTFTLIDEYGCEYPHNMDLKVVQQPEFNLTDQNICVGQTATLDPQFEYVGTPGLIEYYWTDAETSYAISSAETLNIGQNGTYSLCINTFNNDHSLTCTKCDTAQVIFNPQPVVNFSANNVENCAPLNFQLTPNVTYTDGESHDDIILTYQWVITDAFGNVVETSNQENPSFSLQDAGTYTVYLHVETPNGCADSTTKIDYLHVYPQPISDFVSNPERTNLGEGGTISFLNLTDVSVFAENDTPHWTWNYGDGDDESHDVNGEHTYTQWGEYTVTLSVETDQGCQSSVTHVVYIEADLIFPNIITPNGDGKNDVFAIKNMNPLLPNVLSIYDRWGKKVYEKVNYQTYTREGSDVIENAGEGFGAEKLSDGVFYFSFHYEGYTKAVDYHGTITVIRDK